MWDAEKEEYEYHNEEADESKNYLKPSEPNHNGVTYDPSTDFIVMLPHQFIRIPQDSNLAWLTMFYALPKELVSKRPIYLDLPRHIVKLMDSEKYMNLIKQDAFLWYRIVTHGELGKRSKYQTAKAVTRKSPVTGGTIPVIFHFGG